MTTDPIAAARALITDAINFACASNHYLAGQDPEKVQQWLDALATLADALEAERAKVAAAFDMAASVTVDMGPRYDGRSVHYHIPEKVKGAVRALTPADAQAALGKLLYEARLEGWRAGRDAAVEHCWAKRDLLADAEQKQVAAGLTGRDYYGRRLEAELLSRSIRALPEPKEANHG